MPRLQRPCLEPGCPHLTDRSRCETHERAVRRAVDRARAHAPGRAFYRTPQWRALRQEQLARHPFCQCSEHAGALTAPRATVVDHVTPHGGDWRLFTDRANLRSMAKRCHDRKTAREDGRWGQRSSAAPAGGPDEGGSARRESFRPPPARPVGQSLSIAYGFRLA